MQRNIQARELLKTLYTLLPWQIYSIRHRLNVSGKYLATLQLIRAGCSGKYPSLFIARYSVI